MPDFLHTLSKYLRLWKIYSIPGSTSNAMNTKEKQNAIAEFISNGDKDKAVTSLTEWANQSSFKEVIFEILEPMLVEWGKLWMQGKLSLAHGYLGGKVAEEFYVLASQNSEFT